MEAPTRVGTEGRARHSVHMIDPNGEIASWGAWVCSVLGFRNTRITFEVVGFWQRLRCVTFFRIGVWRWMSDL